MVGSGAELNHYRVLFRQRAYRFYYCFARRKNQKDLFGGILKNICPLVQIIKQALFK